MTNNPHSSTLIQRFAGALMRVMQEAAGRFLRNRHRDTEARMLLAQNRMNGLSARLQALLARIEAGTIRPLQAPGARLAAKPRAARATGTQGTAAPPGSRRFGWMVVGDDPQVHLMNFAVGKVNELLLEPETLAQLAKAPRQAGRIVRPICHGLRLAAPEMFRLQPRPRKQRVAKVPEPQAPRRPMSAKWPRVASAKWPKGVVGPGEAVPLRSRGPRGR